MLLFLLNSLSHSQLPTTSLAQPAEVMASWGKDLKLSFQFWMGSKKLLLFLEGTHLGWSTQSLSASQTKPVCIQKKVPTLTETLEGFVLARFVQSRSLLQVSNWSNLFAFEPNEFHLRLSWDCWGLETSRESDASSEKLIQAAMSCPDCSFLLS